MAKQVPGPDSTSDSYDTMLPTWVKLETVLQGTEAMRAAGRLYLPQHQEETAHAYQERLNRSVLLNMLQFTLDSWVGKPFSSPVHVGDDVPPQIQELLENIDLQGNSLEVFCRNWFRDGLHKGFSHILVEFPRKPERPDGLPRTLADDKAENLRPYWVHVRPENLIFAHREYIDGVEVITQARIRETHKVVTGWSEVTQNRIRVLTPGHVAIYVERIDPRTKKVYWALDDEWDTDLPFVPLVTFYADRQDFMVSKPPLTDLADLNISHWQSSSDQRAVLTVARFPILGVSGALSDDKLTVGPHAWLHCPDPAGRFYYVEHTGKAIAAGRQDLLDLEETMAEYGAVFLKKRPGGASATARALDTAETTSPLQDMAIRFQSALQAAVRGLAAWMKIDPAKVGTFTINIDFDQNEFNQPAVDALGVARENKDISQDRYLKELHRYGVLGEDFDEDANKKELQKEQADDLAMQQKQQDMETASAVTVAKAQPKPAVVPGTSKPAGKTKPTNPAKGAPAGGSGSSGGSSGNQ
jgi:hypothetical protein